MKGRSEQGLGNVQDDGKAFSKSYMRRAESEEGVEIIKDTIGKQDKTEHVSDLEEAVALRLSGEEEDDGDESRIFDVVSLKGRKLPRHKDLVVDEMLLKMQGVFAWAESYFEHRNAELLEEKKPVSVAKYWVELINAPVGHFNVVYTVYSVVKGKYNLSAIVGKGKHFNEVCSDAKGFGDVKEVVRAKVSDFIHSAEAAKYAR